jgi:hypothetical protein
MLQADNPDFLNLGQGMEKHLHQDFILGCFYSNGHNFR